jgi:glycosyltransferase
MKVSLITACFNSEASIGRCLNSLNKQSYTDYEHIVIDGASDDRTLEIVRELSPKSQLISEPDKGIYDAINKGIDLARGEVIGLLHSDDFYAGTDILEKIMTVFRETDSDIVYGDLEYIGPSGKMIRNWKSNPFEYRMIGKGWMPPHPTMYIMKDVYDSLGNYNTDYQISADYEFILRVLRSHKFKLSYLPYTFIKMQTGGISNRSFSKIILKSREDLRALKSHGIPCPFCTLTRKNLSKFPQFFRS